jgi:hypothetical protein
MSVPHPGGDPNANLYAQLKRDVLDRVPQIRSVEYVPDAIEARELRAIFDPNRLDPPTGPTPPTLSVTWYRQDPDDWFRVDYTDPNVGLHAGWHQDADHPDLGPAHFQYALDDEEGRRGITFSHDTPSLILWDIVEALLEDVHPRYGPEDD